MHPDTATLLNRPLFDRLLPGLFEREGGARVVRDRADPGGVTKWGISLRWLKSQGALGDTDGDGDIDADDVAGLSREQAADHYWRAYWLEPGWYTLPVHIGAKLLDIGVHAGARAAVRILQRALCATGRTVIVDAVLGPQTRTAAQTAPSRLLKAMCSEQAAYYRELHTLNPKLARFAGGWRRRADWQPSREELEG